MNKRCLSQIYSTFIRLIVILDTIQEMIKSKPIRSRDIRIMYTKNNIYRQIYLMENSFIKVFYICIKMLTKSESE